MLLNVQTLGVPVLAEDVTGDGGNGLLFQTCIQHSYISGKIKVCGSPRNLREAEHCQGACHLSFRRLLFVIIVLYITINLK